MQISSFKQDLFLVINRNRKQGSKVDLSIHIPGKRGSSSIGEQKNITLAGWPLGLGNELGHSSSLIRHGSVGGVGVKGWKLETGVSEEPTGVDSNSLCRSLILCRSSFRYSIASPRIEALSIYQTKPNQTMS